MLDLGSRGMYYYNFIAPNVTGVYMIDVSCTYPNTKETYYPNEGTELYQLDGNTLVIKIGEKNITFSTSFYSYFYAVFYGTYVSTEGVGNIYILKDNSWEHYCQITYYKPDCSKIIENYTGYTPIFKIVTNQVLNLDLANLIQYNSTQQTMTNLRGGGEIHVSYKKTVISDIDMPQARII
jgi:hypothetical protein